MKRQIVDTHKALNFRPCCPLEQFSNCLGDDCAVWAPLAYTEFEAEKWPSREERVYEPGRYGRCGL